MSKKSCGHVDGHHGHDKLYRRLLVAFLGFVVLVLLVILIIWLVLRPTKPKFYLQDATVYAFNRSSDFGTGGLLTTTLQVTVATRNPNDLIGVYYDKLDVYATYKYQQITLATAIPPTYQGHKDVVVWSPFLYGVDVPVSPYLAMSLAEDQNAGLTLLYVKVHGQVRWKVGTWTSGRYHISANCPALLHSGGRGYSPAIRFQLVSTCTVDV